MKLDQRDATYVFDEKTADRLRHLVYNFQAAIDELIARTRVEPLELTDVGFEELGFWESHAALHQRLTNGDVDDDEALF